MGHWQEDMNKIATQSRILSRPMPARTLFADIMPLSLQKPKDFANGQASNQDAGSQKNEGLRLGVSGRTGCL